jgi:hypothetical protein
VGLLMLSPKKQLLFGVVFVSVFSPAAELQDPREVFKHIQNYLSKETA